MSFEGLAILRKSLRLLGVVALEQSTALQFRDGGHGAIVKGHLCGVGSKAPALDFGLGAIRILCGVLVLNVFRYVDFGVVPVIGGFGFGLVIAPLSASVLHAVHKMSEQAPDYGNALAEMLSMLHRIAIAQAQGSLLPLGDSTPAGEQQAMEL